MAAMTVAIKSWRSGEARLCHWRGRQHGGAGGLVVDYLDQGIAQAIDRSAGEDAEKPGSE